MSKDIDKFCRYLQKQIAGTFIGSIEKYSDVDGTVKYRLDTFNQGRDIPVCIAFNNEVHQLSSSENEDAKFQASMLIKQNEYIDYKIGNDRLEIEDLVLSFVCFTEDWIIAPEYYGESSVWGIEQIKPLLDNRLISFDYDENLITLIFNILVLNEIVTVSKKVDFLISCKAEFS